MFEGNKKKANKKLNNMNKIKLKMQVFLLLVVLKQLATNKHARVDTNNT